MSYRAIQEIWRYPVSSIGGEQLERVAISEKGVAGDRTHLLVDLDSGEVASPETTPRWRSAMLLIASRLGDNVFVSSDGWAPMPIGPELDHA